ncbi:MAG: hypothetical protein GXO72_02460 [Caldiserica bacterium]|nr:hypothetical protein [Caldisericota bacterium]
MRSKFLLFLLIAFSVVGLSQEPKRDFAFYAVYPHIVLPEGKEVNLDVVLVNYGENPEEIVFEIAGPEDWNPRLETSSYPRTEIKGLYLLPGEDAKATVKFRAKPPEDAESGDYTFELVARTADGALEKRFTITVTYQREKKETTEEQQVKGLTLLVDYPALENPAGEKFEYEIQIKNEADEDRIVELKAQVPFGWRAYFTPRWKDQRITSIKVNGNASEWIKFVVTPPFGVEKGEYPLTFVASADGVEAKLDLKATVTGTYDLRLGSEAEVFGKGDTRNIKATAGKERIFKLYIWNEGTAPITDIDFFASKPKDWEVKFNPEKLDSLDPIAQTLKPTVVEVKIVPKERAIPGDYEITITAAGKEDREAMKLRVTVGAAMSWGWIGVAVIVVVVAGLTGIFVRLGRR